VTLPVTREMQGTSVAIGNARDLDMLTDTLASRNTNSSAALTRQIDALSFQTEKAQGESRIRFDDRRTHEVAVGWIPVITLGGPPAVLTWKSSAASAVVVSSPPQRILGVTEELGG